MYKKDFTEEEKREYNAYHRDYEERRRRRVGIKSPNEKRTEKKAKFIEEYPVQGNAKATCQAIGISQRSVSLWTNTDEVFRAEYEGLKRDRINELASFLYRVGTDEGIKVAMPNVTAAIFLIKNLAPKEFGERYYREEKKSIKITREEIIKDYGKVSVTRTRELTQGVSNGPNEDTSIP